jgi:hypothetical protein
VLEPTRDDRRDCRRLSRRRIFVPSIVILVLAAAVLFLRTGFGEWGDLETEPHKSIALVRADDSAAHLIETRGGAIVGETPSNGNGKLESAIGI